jgi:hypothetical protein
VKTFSIGWIEAQDFEESTRENSSQKERLRDIPNTSLQVNGRSTAICKLVCVRIPNDENHDYMGDKWAMD